LLVTLPGCGHVGIGWDGVVGVTVSSSTTWTVYRKTATTAYAPILGPLTVSTAGDSGLVNSQTYTYKILETDGANQVYSNESSVTPNCGQIIFNKDDSSATGSMANQSIPSGNTVALTSNTFTKTGWTFAGWATTPWSPGNLPSTITNGASYTMGIANVTLYARWSQDSVVTFDSQSATNPANPTTKTVSFPATTVGTLPTPPTKTGYIFGGWYTAINGGGTVFTAATTVTSSLTVYAKWTPITPPTPTGLTATASTCGNDWLNLSWNVSPRATSYQVKRGGSVITLTEYTCNATSCSGSDTGLTAGSTYLYTVTASNTAGTSAAASASGMVSSICDYTLTINTAGTGGGTTTGAGTYTS